MYPNPIIEIGNLKIYPYGICIAIGLLACILAFYALAKRKGMPEVLKDYVLIIAVLGIGAGFFFAMLFQAFYNWLDGKPFVLFNGGITVMGGLIGGAGMFLLLYFLIGKFYFKAENKNVHFKHFNNLFRIAPICIAIAHGFGRIGCLMGGCCHGQYLGQKYVFGGVWMEGTLNGLKTWGYYSPAQLYEALFLFVLAAVLIYLIQKRCNVIMSIYLIAYGVWRFIIEIFRSDYRGGSMFGFTPSQVTSILFILAGVVLIVVYLIKKWPMFLSKSEDVKIESQEIK